MLVLFLFGFSSGLPLYLTGQTLSAWLDDINAKRSAIAALAPIGLAYTLKFAWAPLLDRFKLPFLGRRRGWIFALQLALVVAIIAMGWYGPHHNYDHFVMLAIAVAVLSASQDVVIDAYKADLLAPEERAAGASVYVVGYRTAMVASGGLAWIMADLGVRWHLIYTTVAVLVGIGTIATYLAEEPSQPHRPPATLAAAVVEPIEELALRFGVRGALFVIAFAVLYKFGDYFVQTLIIPFFTEGAGFDLGEIAIVYKALGFGAIVVGGVLSGTLVPRYGMRRMLVVFGLLQASTNLLYAALAAAGDNLPLFCVAVFVDNATNAMGTAVFVAFLMSVCSPAVSATQFALLTSLSSLGQRGFGILADDVVAAVDWSGLFILSALLAVPGLVLGWWSHKLARTGDDP